jgi:hypothetical protein
MGLVPKETIQRLVLLYIIQRSDKGIYGTGRLQKLAYSALFKAAEKPLTFLRSDHGIFCPQIPSLVEELLSMGYVVSWKLDTVDRDRFYLTTPTAPLEHHSEVLDKYSPGLRTAIDQSIEEYASRRHQKPLEWTRKDDSPPSIAVGEEIFKANLPDVVEIPGLSDAEALELALSLDPEYAASVSRALPDSEETITDLDQSGNAGDAP